jgi:uncharacterized membrane protein required for colicin V production
MPDPSPSLAAVNALDLLGLAAVLLFLVLGFRGGLWWQLVRLLGLVATVAVARGFAPPLAAGLEDLFTDLAPRVASGLAWTAVLLAGLAIVALVGRIGGRAEDQGDELGLVDRVGGAVAGCLTGLVLHAALLLCLAHFGAPEWTGARVRGSHSQAFLQTLGRGIPGLVEPPAAHALGIDARDS